MRPSTVDLLRIRDGEPVDAAVRVAVESDPRLRAELEGLVASREALRALPLLEPPAGGWSRVAARLAIEAEPRTADRRYWAARAAIAAGVAVVALWVVGRAPDTPSDDGAPATIVAEDASETRPLLGTPTYASLVEESARLERALDGLGYQRGVVRAGTAATISGLEDRIAWIDEQLTFAPQLGLSAAERRTLYRQRVELLNALYQVRYAEARRFAF